MSEREIEVMAEQFGKLQWQVELLESKLNEQSIPLPTVPTDATCGGCRWWRAATTGNHCGQCYSEPQAHARLVDEPACRHYEGKK